MSDLIIDLKSTIEEFLLNNSQINQLKIEILKALVDTTYSLWNSEVKQDLKSSRDIYLAALQKDISEDFIGRIYLVSSSPLPEMIEQGVDPFDLKTGFAQSSKIKLKKGGGWYLTIPFRYAVSSALGENQAFTQVLPKKIEEIVKAKSKKSDKPLKLKEIPEQYRISNVRKGVLMNKKFMEEYSKQTNPKKTTLYEGLTRTSSLTASNQNKYSIFRRVSDLSEANSWIHTGIEGRHFADLAFNKLNIDQIVDAATDKALFNLGFGTE